MNTDLPNRSESDPVTVSGFVMAGGASVRMGSSKANLPWPSAAEPKQTLLDHAIDRLQQVCASVKLCSSQEYATQVPVPRIPDALPGAGPLGGIVAALEQSTTDWNIFLAVDLPLVPVAFLQSLISRISRVDGAPLSIVPTLNGQPQPLCSLLHRSLAPELRRALEAGKYKLMLAFQTAAPRAIDLWEIKDLTAATILQSTDGFLNVNTPSELECARRLAGQELHPQN